MYCATGLKALTSPEGACHARILTSRFRIGRCCSACVRSVCNCRGRRPRLRAPAFLGIGQGPSRGRRGSCNVTDRHRLCRTVGGGTGRTLSIAGVRGWRTRLCAAAGVLRSTADLLRAAPGVLSASASLFPGTARLLCATCLLCAAPGLLRRWPGLLRRWPEFVSLGWLRVPAPIREHGPKEGD